jgi:folate-dependent phosphoribosylglycinamide formyltransferase PurN
MDQVSFFCFFFLLLVASSAQAQSDEEFDRQIVAELRESNVEVAANAGVMIAAE